MVFVFHNLMETREVLGEHQTSVGNNNQFIVTKTYHKPSLTKSASCCRIKCFSKIVRL